MFPGEGHSKYQPAHRYNVYRRNIQWMKFWLQGETVDDPMDPGQYDRWTGLCAGYVAKLKASDNKSERARGAPAVQKGCNRLIGEGSLMPWPIKKL